MQSTSTSESQVLLKCGYNFLYCSEPRQDICNKVQQAFTLQDFDTIGTWLICSFMVHYRIRKL
jgi:hypothetical protein